ncbi:hypothetical protein ACIKTA_02510 [Hansschlegelia beijingensis]
MSKSTKREPWLEIEGIRGFVRKAGAGLLKGGLAAEADQPLQYLMNAAHGVSSLAAEFSPPEQFLPVNGSSVN